MHIARSRMHRTTTLAGCLAEEVRALCFLSGTGQLPSIAAPAVPPHCLLSCDNAAFDKGDLLYLRDEEEKRRFSEQALLHILSSYMHALSMCFTVILLSCRIPVPPRAVAAFSAGVKKD